MFPTIAPPSSVPCCPSRLTLRMLGMTGVLSRTLGVQVAKGREFTAAEGAPGGELVAMVSDGFWRRWFGADPNILGKQVDINGRLRTVVGVMPADFVFPDREALIWLPMVIDTVQAPLGAFGPQAVGRLAPGASVESLHTELQGLIARLSEFFASAQMQRRRDSSHWISKNDAFLHTR